MALEMTSAEAMKRGSFNVIAWRRDWIESKGI